MRQKVFFLLAILCMTISCESDLDQRIDEGFQPISNFFTSLIFFEVFAGVPFVLLLLIFSALFFTIYFGFINIRKFGTAIQVVRGKFDDVERQSLEPGAQVHEVGGDVPDTIRDESKQGEVSHFQALATAVSGTVGNGNIAGVALAIALGGPGATFWMIICGLLGMSTKMVECTLGVRYRDVGEDGTVYGGPSYYLKKGLADKGFQRLGKIVAIFFAIFCIGGSFGGGNAAQSNQATIVIKDLVGWTSDSAGTMIGIVMAILVGIIIIGGIKRIASVTEKVVPFMAVFYVLGCLYIIFSNFGLVDDVISLIVREAFNPTAIGVGSIMGVLLVGFRRACFSNEAGAGSASIAHSAVRTKFAASEGLVALLEPFIDTVLICTMTAMVIIIFNMGGHFDYGGDGTGAVMIDGTRHEGAGITTYAFMHFIPYSDIFLAIAVVLFAISTMISWSYYGLQSWKFLFGRGRTMDTTYKLLFCTFIIIGAAANMGSIWDFSDAMIFAMVFPNMIGLYFLFPQVKKELRRYFAAIKASSSNKS